jgi:hypothetical protein
MVFAAEPGGAKRKEASIPGQAVRIAGMVFSQVQDAGEISGLSDSRVVPCEVRRRQ